jgi:glycosyltransferase involved in cell wall biosynthesis
MNIALITWSLTKDYATGEGVDAYELASALSSIGLNIKIFCQKSDVSYINNNVKIINFGWRNKKYSYSFILKSLSHILCNPSLNIIHQMQLDKTLLPLTTKTYVLSGYLNFARYLELYPYIQSKIIAEMFKNKESVQKSAPPKFFKNRIESIFDNFFEKSFNVFYNRVVSNELIYNKAKRIIARHKDLKVWLEKKGCESSKIEVIPVCINTGIYRPGKRESHTNCRILFVGRLVPIKGIKLLIDAFLDLIKEVKHAELLVIGDGPLRTELETMLTKLKIKNRVKLLGSLPRSKILEYYQSSDIFALPSFYESFGIVNLEAMSCGLPVISTFVGGIPEVVKDGYSGFLIEPGNKFLLKEYLIKLISDDGLREKIGYQARQHVVRNFSYEVIIPKMIEVYEEALSSI